MIKAGQQYKNCLVISGYDTTDFTFYNSLFPYANGDATEEERLEFCSNGTHFFPKETKRCP